MGVLVTSLATQLASAALTSVDTDERDDLTAGESTMSRRYVTATGIATGNGTLRLAYFTARKTETITQLRVPTGSAAMAGATLCRMGIYSVDGSNNLTLVASTPNDTTLFAATSTAYTKALSASFSKVRGQRYAFAILVVGSTTAPQLTGQNQAVLTEQGISPQLGGSFGGQTDLPSTITAANAAASAHHAYAALIP